MVRISFPNVKLMRCLCRLPTADLQYKIPIYIFIYLGWKPWWHTEHTTAHKHGLSPFWHTKERNQAKSHFKWLDGKIPHFKVWHATGENVNGYLTINIISHRLHSRFYLLFMQSRQACLFHNVDFDIFPSTLGGSFNIICLVADPCSSD